jgi:hypothetical protein
LDESLHKETAFYKMNMLEGVLEDFLDKLNLHIEPLKELILNLDRFFLLFLVIGFIATVIMAIVFG